MLGDSKKAKDYMILNLKNQPNNPKSNYEMAMVLFDSGQKQDAIGYLRKALLVWQDADDDYKPAALAREKLSEWEHSL